MSHTQRQVNTESVPTYSPLDCGTFAKSYYQMLFQPGDLSYLFVIDHVKNRTQTFWFEYDPENTPHIERQPHGCSVYVGVNVSNRQVPGRSGIDNISMIRVLFADLDQKDGWTESKVLALDPQPTMIVCTGGGWHVYWALKKALTDMERAARLQRQWVQYIGGDDGSKDLAHILRPPGYVNAKPGYGDDPPVVRLVEHYPDNTYTAAHLERLCDKANGLHIDTSETNWTLDDWYDELSGLAEGDERNVRFNKAAFIIGQNLPTWGVSRADVEPKLIELAIESGLDKAEATYHIHRALGQGLASGQTTIAGKALPVWRRKERPLQADYEEQLARADYVVRYNEMNQDIEVKTPSGRVIPELDDHTDELIKAMFRETNYPLAPWTQYQHSISEKHRFHPIKDYLADLPAWDGVDHIGHLLEYVQCDRSKLFKTLFTKKLVASIARVYDVDAFFPVFVLLGNQRLGKSWFVRWLSPLPEYHYEGPVHPDDNDCLVRVGTTFFWEIGELGSTTKRADVESLKLFLTLPFIKVRKSYGRRDVRFPVCTSYWATVNESGFLKDRTGNSRFIVFNVGDIDWSYKDNVDHEQLWAQVYALYSQGYDWRLSEDELAYQKESNAEHRLKDPTDEAIFTLFEFTGAEDDVLTTARVSERVKDLPDTSTYGLRLRMEAFGAGYKKSYRVNDDLNTSVYTGVKFRDRQEQTAWERLAEGG